MRSLIGLRGMPRETLEELLARSEAYAGDGPGGRPDLEGRTVATLFLEPSTRTRLSFERAARLLRGEVMAFDPESSSLGKGESIGDTAAALAALGADVLVIRHPESGGTGRIARTLDLPVVNAGDGMNEHPTQTLCDALTLRRHFGSVDGLRVAIVGDVLHSRVAGSHVHGLATLGARLFFVAPREWVPPGTDVPVTEDLDDLISDVDVVYLLRIQAERGAQYGNGSRSSYARRFGVTGERVRRMGQGAVVMHPGPINRGVEIEDAVADGPRSLILDQVRNGVPARMAVLSWVVEDAG